MMKMYGLAMFGLVAAALIGCGDAQPAVTAVQTAYLTSAEPAGARTVADVKSDSKDGDDVVLVGKVGGSTDPFVKGCAAFTVVDPSEDHCSPDACTTCPCCMAGDKSTQAMVQVVDEQGNLVETDARQLLGLKGPELVVVQGKAKRDDQGNLTVLASKVFVRR